ncbi:MAG: sel1 repeat family protein [Opitutales bacterium]|nr:sel1 repeat family protein [Opitutales bacterium]
MKKIILTLLIASFYTITSFGAGLISLKQMAKQGNPSAQLYIKAWEEVNEYGFLLPETKIALDKAPQWAHQQAEQGDPCAQLILALCYNEGGGVKQCSMKAFAWASLASWKGLNRAKTMLEYLKKECLTDVQLKIALKMAQNYRRGNFGYNPEEDLYNATFNSKPIDNAFE